jgi:alkylation response protein AidB-like acyl-CoA dehydrogenase
VHFGFSAEQQAAADGLRRLLAERWTATHLVSAWDEPGGVVARRGWELLGEFGLLGLLVPEACGGSAGTPVDLVLLLEEAGAACVPGPVVETAVVAVAALLGLEEEEARVEWLARIAVGDARFAVVLDPDEPVPHAQEADAFVVVGPTVRVVARQEAGCTPLPSEDPTRLLGSVSFADGFGLRVGTGRRDGLLRSGAWAAATLLVGVARGLLEQTVAYVRQRRQFGRPLATMQSIQHELADCHVELEGARGACWYAAWALATEAPDATIAASTAKILASSTMSRVNRAALQFHGAIGFTWDLPLHRWLKRGLALQAAFGDLLHHAEVVAAEQDRENGTMSKGEAR